MYAGDTSGDAESADYAGIPFIYAAYGFGNVSSDKYIAKIDDIKNLPELMKNCKKTHGRIVKNIDMKIF